MIYHVARMFDWLLAVEAGGPYRVSTLGRTLDEVGFIHCSRRDQVDYVLATVYADFDEPLCLLTIDETAVEAEIRYETPPGATEDFPHLYGPLPIHAVVRIEAAG